MQSLHFRNSLLILAILSLLGLCILITWPIALYLSALLEPDIYGYPDCDTLNDWLTHVLPVLQDAIYRIATRICLRYPYS